VRHEKQGHVRREKEGGGIGVVGTPTTFASTCRGGDFFSDRTSDLSIATDDTSGLIRHLKDHLELHQI